jgi:integrase
MKVDSTGSQASTSRPSRCQSITVRTQRVCRLCGIPHNWHSYSTALIRSGVPVKTVSQRIGHASPTITMTIYQHVLPGDDDQAAIAGARAIFGDSSL